MHVKDNDDEDGLQFSEMIEALGLTQWVNFPTHNQGKTLDLILTEIVSNFNITSVNQGQFLSDHCSVITFLDYPKPRRSTKSVSYRKWKDIDVNDFIADIHVDELKFLDCSFEDLLDRMDYVQKALEKHAPLKYITSGILSKKLWYNKDLHEERKSVRKAECRWKQQKKQSDWLSFTQVRKNYIRHLNSAHYCLKAKITKKKDNTKQL